MTYIVWLSSIILWRLFTKSHTWNGSHYPIWRYYWKFKNRHTQKSLSLIKVLWDEIFSFEYHFEVHKIWIQDISSRKTSYDEYEKYIDRIFHHIKKRHYTGKIGQYTAKKACYIKEVYTFDLYLNMSNIPYRVLILYSMINS